MIETMTGTVKWFDAVKGYGFIETEQGGDIFVHQSEILMSGYRYLEAGQKVSYEVELTNRGAKARSVIIES